MNARGLLFTCLALIVGSIVLVPESVQFGLRSDIAAALSTLSLLGGIATAFLTVKAEREAVRQK